MRSVIGLLTLLLFLVPVPASAIPILVNGSFESGPVIAPFEDINIAGGSTAITGWTVTGNVIDYLGREMRCSGRPSHFHLRRQLPR